MSETDRVVREEFEISAATPNGSHTSLGNELKIEPEKRTEVEDRNELGETAKKPEKVGEAEENLSTLQELESNEELRDDPEESREDLKQPEELKAQSQTELADLSVEDLQNPESSGDTEVLTFGSSVLHHPELKSQRKFKPLEEATESEEEFRIREGSGDTEDPSYCSSFISCRSYKKLRQSILQRDRHSSTVSLNSFLDLDCLPDPSQKSEDPDRTSYGNSLPCYSSSVSIVMKGRSLSLPHNTSEIGFEGNKNCWPYFSRTDIDGALSVFKQVDEDKNGYISLCELKRFLEILEIPQTHLKAKKMMANVVGGSEDRLNFGEVLLIYGSLRHRLVPLKWRLNQRQRSQLVNSDEVDVSQVGVSGAKLFFEAKIALQTPSCPREQFKSDAAVFKKLDSEP